MKKLTIIILSIIILSTCYPLTAKQEQAILLVAYNSLSDQEQALIQVSPKDATLTEEAVSTEIMTSINLDYQEKKVYAVVFNDTATDLAGNLIVYADLDKTNVVGKGVEELN